MTVDGDKKKRQDRASIILSNYKRSYNWMKDGFYSQWEKVHKNYLCEADPKIDPYAEDNSLPGVPGNTLIYDSTGRPYPSKASDSELTSLSTPDTWSLERRRAARATAQLPNLRYMDPKQDVANRVSRALMYQWDMQIQPTQKRHVLQADMFGISVRAWSYITEREHRMRTINPLKMTPDQEQLIQGQFGEEIGMITQMLPPMPDAQLPPGTTDPRVYAELLKLKGNGTRLKVGQDVLVYTGPTAQVLFLGDCFFEPMFQSLQTSAWFITQRRRDKAWFEDLVSAYPEAADYVEDLLKSKPYGTPFSNKADGTDDTKNLRENMASIVNQGSQEGEENEDPDAARYTVLEIHYTGAKSRVEYVCDSQWIGAYDQPHELSGRIPFTSLCLHESLLHGIGDTDARVIRGLQDLRSRLVCQRADMGDALLRPLVGTDDQSIMDDPSLVRRWKGLRLVQLKHPNAMWSIQDQAALAGAANGFNEEGAMNRLIQQATNESNMSNSADADPQQGKTATGARIIARNQDILTRDMLNQLNKGIREDAQMMFRLNRVEMQDDLTFDGSAYRPPGGGPMSQPGVGTPPPPPAAPPIPPESPVPPPMGMAPEGAPTEGAPPGPPPGPPAPPAPDMSSAVITVTPEDFQGDFQVEPEVGSTLAEDDEDNLNRATVLFQLAASRPDLFNQMKARNELLIAYKQGHRLEEWNPPPPPEKPPGVEMKISTTVNATLEELTPESRSAYERLLVASANSQGANTVKSPTKEDVEGNVFTKEMQMVPAGELGTHEDEDESALMDPAMVEEPSEEPLLGL